MKLLSILLSFWIWALTHEFYSVTFRQTHRSNYASAVTDFIALDEVSKLRFETETKSMK